MKSESSCFPCFVEQVHSSVLYAMEDDEKRWQVLAEVSQLLPGLRMTDTPAYNSSLMLHMVNELMDVTDPYAAAKKDSNQAALAMVPSLLQKIRAAADKFETAVRLSVVGNVIDLGIKHEADLNATIDQALLPDGFARFDYPALKERIAKAQRILYLCDNAGEIVFDRIVMEGLRAQKKMVVAAVKSGPILNDATMEDAKAVGLDKVARVIDTGSDYVGVVREKCSEMFLKVLDTADLVIAKGQGNFETLDHLGGRAFFILKTKCPYVARALNVPLNSLVLAQG
jgi:damage-control phosphatase, subfamily I